MNKGNRIHNSQRLGILSNDLKFSTLKDFIANAESAYQSIVVTKANFDNPIIYVNPAFTELNGYTLEEALGRNANFLRCDNFDHTKQRKKIKTALEQKTPVIAEMINKHKDGTNFLIELHVFPFYENGECTNFIGIQKDLSILDNSNYFNFFNETPVAFLRTDIESGKFLMANNACAGLLGYNSVKALIAEQKMSDLYFDKGQRKKLLNKLHKSGRVENYEIELKLKDGRHVWVSTHLHMVCNGKCIEGTLIDITSHKQMEHRLEQMSKSYLIKMQKLSADIDAKITEFGELPMPLKTAGFTVST